MSGIVNKLNDLALDKKSDWILDAVKRNENKECLKFSQMMALKVLCSLRTKNMSQEDLAVNMNMNLQQVSEIVKGKGSITLETILKLEKALGINLR